MTNSGLNQCDALVVTCMDFRLQQHLDPWLASVLGTGQYDRVSVAGGVKDQAFVLSHVTLGVNLHSVRLVLLLNHEDCGAYGAEGTMQRHQQDLRATAAAIEARYPGLVVVLGYLSLDGTFSHVPKDGDSTLPLDAIVRDALGS